MTLFCFMTLFSLGQNIGGTGSLKKHEFEMYNLHNDSTFVSSMINECSANEIVSYENNPRSIVEYFIAAHIRKDLLGISAVLKLADKDTLEKFNSYKILHAAVIDRSVSHDNHYVKVFLVIAIPEGSSIAGFQSGKDDFTCRKIDGVWKIVGIPN